MRIKEKRDENKGKKIAPHKIFAWLPVWAWDGIYLDFVWLEYVTREHPKGSILKWTYRVIEK